MILECRECEKLFSHPVELKKHNVRKHDQIDKFETNEDLNQTISSLQELKSRQLIFPIKKRKSIFDGVDVQGFKRRKVEKSPKKVNIQKESSEKVEKFIFTFNCKECTLTFTKFGQFRLHTETHNANRDDLARLREPNDNKENLEEISAAKELGKTPQNKKSKEIKSLPKYPCEDCSSRFVVHDDFRKPFAIKLQKRLLKGMPIHFSSYPGYVKINSKFPGIRPRSVVKLDQDEFIVGELKGEGGFAKVYSATWSNGPESEMDSVLKIQKPANDWEWYILNELQSRLSNLNHDELGPGSDWKESFMSSPRCFTYEDGSIIVSKHQKYGTLLDMINITSTADKAIAEPLAVHLGAEILGLVDILHTMDFVHADLKPDNFMIKEIPGRETSKAIQIIDFGKTIDLRTIPPEAVFDDVVETSGLKSVEMREKRPWRHHIDYFGVAAVVYCLLFGQYMDVIKVRGRWAPRGTYKRGWKIDFWKRFFDEFLNLQGAEKKCLPSLLGWRKEFLELFQRENMSVGLAKARDVLERKCVARRRRTL
eukprot:GFUD01044026.1.p1 GENE.GFUD01044026.1~~GFUD01044026.1.p1  ORF type:complete len:538 (+),score=136.95 GFUD01044026.1:76-1689(+)